MEKVQADKIVACIESATLGAEIGAGTHTSSATVEWAISELIRCPRAMEKVQAELRQALNGKEKIQEEDIQDLPYLNLVLNEKTEPAAAAMASSYPLIDNSPLSSSLRISGN
ncbi:hypothetical protein L2E82_17399 [Cichorium intybus]|uniref:Uncharacterized protein n=1 Tax=Cichorium intybus TaxID=13427 RepID=A0ACB9F7M6_CICIN|nr:hypothetical protein L2E82_17399 [Cichorium intybus]